MTLKWPLSEFWISESQIWEWLDRSQGWHLSFFLLSSYCCHRCCCYFLYILISLWLFLLFLLLFFMLFFFVIDFVPIFNFVPSLLGLLHTPVLHRWGLVCHLFYCIFCQVCDTAWSACRWGSTYRKKTTKPITKIWVLFFYC